MTSILITDRSGKSLVVEGDDGKSVMEVIRESGYDDSFAICGGYRMCATCHVYVESDHLRILPPIEDEENDLLDSAENRQDNSRLSCQLRLDAALEGLRVRIAPEA